LAPGLAAAKLLPERDDTQGWNFNLRIKEYAPPPKLSRPPMASAKGRVEYRAQKNQADCYTAWTSGQVSSAMPQAVAEVKVYGDSCRKDIPPYDSTIFLAKQKVVTPLSDTIPLSRRQTKTFSSGEIRDVKNVTVELCTNNPPALKPIPST
jgi:hypothetical protein